MNLVTFSFRFAQELLNSRLQLLNEIGDIINESLQISIPRPTGLNKELRERFENRGWKSGPEISEEIDGFKAKLDFLKEKIGVEVQFGHQSFIGIDLLKLNTAGNLEKIDVGIYLVATKKFQKEMDWNSGLLTYEKVISYLVPFKSSIHIPIYVIGIDI